MAEISDDNMIRAYPNPPQATGQTMVTAPPLSAATLKVLTDHGVALHLEDPTAQPLPELSTAPSAAVHPITTQPEHLLPHQHTLEQDQTLSAGMVLLAAEVEFRTMKMS